MISFLRFRFIWKGLFAIFTHSVCQRAEIDLFENNFESIILGTYETITPENEGNMFTKNDFNNLCKINLNEERSFQSFYDLLRALSHGDYKNAFFVDPKTGKKVYLKLEISYE